MRRRLTALLTALVLLAVLSACGGSGQEGGRVAITVLNSKMEIQDQMQAMAEAYSATHDADVSVLYSTDSVSAHLATRYASDEPYTLAMVDAKDVYALAGEHALDLSGENWVSHTTQAISVDGKVCAFPFCVEGRGIIYNADAIERITGEAFNPASVRTTAAFQALIDRLIAGGMETPTGVMKEDWSLGAHYLAEVYEQQADPDAFLAGLHDGSVDLAQDPKFNTLMDTFDILRDNSYTKDAALSADREQTEQKLAKGEIAFLFGGSWDWAVLNQYSPTDRLGLMPVPNDSGDGSNELLVGGGSKYFILDSSKQTSKAQVKAAKDFLNWLVEDEQGQDYLVNQCGVFAPFDTITLPLNDPLSESVKECYEQGKLINNYNFLPDDHYPLVGAAMQRYLAGEIDRAALAQAVSSYWSAAQVVAH